MADSVTNIVLAGLGGQGVITCADILAHAAFAAGHDVKKAEVHGMSQRGGSVTSDVRYGRKVLSPMVTPGEADFLVVLDDTQVEPARHYLRAAGGVLLQAGRIDPKTLPHPRALNVAMLGMLSAFLDLPDAAWHAAIRANLAPKLHDINLKAFEQGKAAADKEKRHV